MHSFLYTGCLQQHQLELRVVCIRAVSGFFRHWQRLPSELDGASVKTLGCLFLSRILGKMKHICSFSGIFGAFNAAQCPALFVVLNTYSPLSSRLLSGGLI